MTLAVVAIAISAIFITILCLGDPKRRRSVRLPGDGQRVATRRLIAAAACLPGLACIVAGNAASFLIWLGGSGVLGWLVTLWFGRQARSARP